MSRPKKPKAKQKPKVSRPQKRPSDDPLREPLPFSGLTAVKYILGIVYALAAFGYAGLCWRQYVIIDHSSRVEFVILTFLQLMVLLAIFWAIYRFIKFFARFISH